MLKRLRDQIDENLGATEESHKDDGASVSILPGQSGADRVQIAPGDLLQMQTACNGRRRDLYKSLVFHFHSIDKILAGVPVPDAVEQKCSGKLFEHSFSRFSVHSVGCLFCPSVHDDRFCASLPTHSYHRL